MWHRLLDSLWKDEAGFVVSAELILVATITVLSMVVGLAEVSFAVNHELADVASAFDSVNQSYGFQGQDGNPGTWYDDGDGEATQVALDWSRPVGEVTH